MLTSEDVLIHQHLIFVFTCCVLSVMFIHKFVIVVLKVIFK